MSEQALKGIPIWVWSNSASVILIRMITSKCPSSLFNADPQASVSASSVHRGELVVREGLYCAIQPHLQGEGEQHGYCRFKMCCPAQGAAKKTLTAACSCVHSDCTTSTCLYSDGILMWSSQVLWEKPRQWWGVMLSALTAPEIRAVLCALHTNYYCFR